MMIPIFLLNVDQLLTDTVKNSEASPSCAAATLYCSVIYARPPMNLPGGAHAHTHAEHALQLPLQERA
jgi:hypothetical protein